MANIKISELTALTPPDAADLVPVTDSSASQTKRTTVGEIVGIVNGDVDVADDGTATISELPVSKLQDGAARQLLQTDAAGTGVEWTSNVDVPGTLDVTGATTLDSTLGVTGQSTLASAAVSDLTSGRVVLAGTSGELEDSAGLTFNGTQLDVDGDVVITGDLTVEGASTILETETVKVEDKNIELGVVASPTDVTADGGGITLKGTTDKTFNWVDATDSWTSSEHVDLASGKSYRINGTEVLSATALGSAVQISSANIPNGTIVDADVNASAEIAVSKLADGSARQLLQTDAAGTGVEWTSNVDVPGTLDVTGATTLDSTLTVPAGSEAAPTVRFTGDTNTGIYSPGADQLALSTNGTGRLFVDASGRIIINSSSSFASINADDLQIGDITDSAQRGITLGSTAAGSIRWRDATGDAGIISYLHSDDSMRFHTVDTERLRITSAGFVGIGTSAPSATLNVTGSSNPNFLSNRSLSSGGSGAATWVAARIQATTTEQMSAGFGVQQDFALRDADAVDNTVAAIVVSRDGADNSGSFAIRTASAGTLGTRLHVTSGGSVGIGTTPDARLTIQDGANIVARVKQLALDSYSNEGPGITFGRISDGVELSAVGVADSEKLLLASREGVLFGVGGSGLYSAVSEAARIDSAGRLLVGTSSAPNSAEAYAKVQIADPLGPHLILGREDTTVTTDEALGLVRFYSKAGNSWQEGARIAAFSDAGQGLDDKPSRLVFSTTADGASSPTERLRITSAGVLQVADAGNIAVGTTTGTKIGTATTQKLGFFNATPVVQPAAVADATDAATVITQLNDLLAKLRTLGIIAT